MKLFIHLSGIRNYEIPITKSNWFRIYFGVPWDKEYDSGNTWLNMLTYGVWIFDKTATPGEMF